MKPLFAHSITEAHLYCIAQVCEACQSGSVEVVQEAVEQEHIDSVVRLECRCLACAADMTLRFRIDSQFARAQYPPVINPGSTPSNLIDVGTWLTLHHGMLAKAEGTVARQEVRRLRLLAGLCIEEALKFYEPDNDLPPPRAFFTNQAWDNALRQPELYARSALLARRARLPILRDADRGESRGV